MKKATKKLTLNKISISNLNQVKGGGEALTLTKTSSLWQDCTVTCGYCVTDLCTSGNWWCMGTDACETNKCTVTSGHWYCVPKA